MPTVYELASEITPLGMDRSLALPRNRKGKDLPHVTDGMKPTQPPLTEGLHVLAPEQLLNLIVPVVSVNGRIEGYQRLTGPPHARNMARAMLDGYPFPPIIVALEGRKPGRIVDGGHRAVAAVIAHLPIQAVFQRYDVAQQRDLFAGQRKAKPVDANTLILAGGGPYEHYIQAAVSSPDHPWSQIVAAGRTSRTKISPHQVLQLLLRFVGNSESSTASAIAIERWDSGLADQLALLVGCFGSRQTNPLAFAPTPIRAIGSTAMHVFRRNETQAGDTERWVTHMPKFAFENYPFVRTSPRMTDELLMHWNKRLSAERRVTR